VDIVVQTVPILASSALLAKKVWVPPELACWALMEILSYGGQLLSIVMQVLT
jgi:hypothetical protein